LQAYFILNGNWTTSAVVSVVLSCLSTGFSTAMIAYDLDTNPSKRKSSPEFFGYVPDTSMGRIMTFLVLFVLHSAHALLKTFAVACLARTNLRWLVAYVAVDHGVYILYKTLRGDLAYWVPGLGIPLSLAARWIQKIFLDATGCVHLRLPGEAGGVYFCVNAVLNTVAAFAAAGLYSANGAPADGAPSDLHPMGNVSSAGSNRTASGDVGAVLGDSWLYGVVGLLATTWAVAFACLLLTMKRQYLPTFYSFQTGFDYSRSYFLDNEGNDAVRVNIFYRNERHWRSIRQQVRLWVLRVYAAWLLLSPVWLTARLRMLIPDDFVPAAQEPAAQPPQGAPSFGEASFADSASAAVPADWTPARLWRQGTSNH
jgi:hypothetical protein